MGLSKQEIDERYDEIVRFSELGDFIDQPTPHLFFRDDVRLAFSVAVNVDADILIVDEALAVGDAIFQHRCFRKIREMQEARENHSLCWPRYRSGEEFMHGCSVA